MLSSFWLMQNGLTDKKGNIKENYLNKERENRLKIGLIPRLLVQNIYVEMKRRI